MAKSETKLKVSDILSHGCENALTLRDLSAILDMGEREIRRMIQQERNDGAPILSDCQNGYFLPAAEDDVSKFVRSMRIRAGEIYRTAEAVERGCCL